MLHIHCAVAAMDHEVSGQAGFLHARSPLSSRVRCPSEPILNMARTRQNSGRRKGTTRVRVGSDASLTDAELCQSLINQAAHEKTDT